MRILFAAFEAVPFAKTGGLGDVAGSLPAALNKNGADVRLIMPKFGSIPERFMKDMTHVADFYLKLSWRNQYCGIEVLEYNGVTIYFIDNQYYFYRNAVYGFGDDGERAAFFSMAVLETLRYIDFCPQIIHCNDWHTSLIPSFLKTFYSNSVMCDMIPETQTSETSQGSAKEFNKIRTVFTVHNLKFQGIFSQYVIGDVLGMSYEQALYCGMIQFDNVNFMRGALCSSDKLTTVSPTYAQEICTDFYGEHAQDIFISRAGDLQGIMNGIDTKALNPATDKNLPAHYTARRPENVLPNKAIVKQALQERLNLEIAPDKPIFSIISRLTDQKGLDLVIAIIDEFMQLDVQFIVLGVGEHKYEDKFKELAGRMPDKFSAAIYFDEPLSRLIYAGSDFMLVPSLFEPCGLTQITAMRYGSIPIVRETGGLKDSVIPYDAETSSGTGFTFTNYNAHELLFKMKDAIEVYRDKEAFAALVLRAMKTDYSWKVSAKKYMKLYSELVD